MPRYISQTQARVERVKLRVARRKLRLAMATLSDISEGYCCESCEPDDPRCPVGQAKDALRLIKEIRE